MSSAPKGHSLQVGCPGCALLEARLARSAVLRETDPFIRTQPTTSNPAPLGFFSFGFCGLIYMALLAGWIKGRDATFLMYAFFFTFAGVGEILVGLLEYSRHNVFAMNAFLVYSFFWIATALKGTLQLAGVCKHDAKSEQMTFVLFGFITIFFWFQTLVTTVATSLLFFTLFILFFLLGAEQTHPEIKNEVAGFGVLVCILALYNGAAVLTIEMYGRELLPVVHIKWGPVRKLLASASMKFGPVGTRRTLPSRDSNASSDVEAPPEPLH